MVLMLSAIVEVEVALELELVGQVPVAVQVAAEVIVGVVSSSGPDPPPCSDAMDWAAVVESPT